MITPLAEEPLLLAQEPQPRPQQVPQCPKRWGSIDGDTPKWIVYSL